jgi:hypothetical protein
VETVLPDLPEDVSLAVRQRLLNETCPEDGLDIEELLHGFFGLLI